MNITQQGVIALLKSALTGGKVALPEEFNMEKAYPLLRNHGVMAMGYMGALNCGVSKDQPVMQKLRMDYGACLVSSQGQMADIARVCAAFEEKGIAYMPMKGCNLKALYPNHELRGMSDADILIRCEQYDEIRELMLQLGFKEEYESEHELVWRSNFLCLELHKQMVPSGNKEYHAYYGDGWKRAKLNNGCRYSMTKEDEYVYLFTHFAKHYRNGGVGCRHVVDLWVYRQAYPQLDEAYIRKELGVLHLDAFYQNVQQLLQVWFLDAPCDDVTEFISQIIFENGNWGTAKSHALSDFVRNKKEADGAGKGKFYWVMRRLFPPVERLSGQYGVLKKYPVMLPLVWLWRIGELLLFRHGKMRQEYRKLTNITPEEIESREQALAYVGLRFED